ncbi:disulfide bond formation protein DsbD [Ancylomarina euxinus]|uniref:Disulfide bond formation protein DsbD n=1 Tax=Ancylomarina euxinus TaxID=2283627 RepID=A0A425XYY1_9BACT|nr:cytochrome c biogenesis protein CcdA [Ancylomarina euxinus]MCZ4695777.1 thioredoxin family protein [Ancylomarina euxinus]MUP16230.1 disulfide bond formation protein DsbD [Ancylomarina euxinus]RRG20088.1 disulfide bond formation protein DsbD [Ancylomarina euxinus]
MKLNFKFALVFILSSMITLSAFSQIVQPAKWKIEFSKKDVKVGETLEVLIKGDLEDTWHVYSNDFDPDLGPIVASFNFAKNDSYELVGKVMPINAHKHYDEVWEGEVSYFEKKAEFRQTIKALKANVKVSGSFEYQACTDVSGRCVTGEEDFDLALTAQTDVVKVAAKELVKETVAKKEETKGIVAVVKEDVKTETLETTPIQKKKDSKKGLWAIFIAAFVGGLIAIVTPCVFPMIPMTVSYFMHSGGGNKAKGRMNAFFYGFSIIAIYTIIGTILAVVMGPDFANFLSTHWVPNVLFFIIFVVFAFSFFGMFEITMPSWMVNKSVANEDKGGFMGSFFMAFTLVLVSFSCTGPIVGSILVASAGGEVLMPIIGMLGFSLAFALPFTLFAIFPGWLNNMPKSGGWLNSVKVVLGFLELALGLKFLSIADQTYHWGILDREVYLAIWIVIFTLMGFYLLGKLMFSHDSPVKHVSVPRLLLAIASFSFVVYMIPGMFGAPLKALSGFTPPKSSLDFDIPTLIVENAGSGGVKHEKINAKYSDFLHLPHGLQGYFDMDEAKAAAKAQNKPLFIDFTGHGCVNCREMESNVWSNTEVLRRLRDDYIIVAMYVDDKKQLPKEEWIVSNYDGKTKKTLGKKNANYQIEHYNVNAQPYYVLLDNEDQALHTPRAYDLDVDAFVKFLDEGLKNFKNGTSVAL